MRMIYAIEQLPKKEDTWVFLGGPIQGAPEWQETVPDIQGVTWINPRRKEIMHKLLKSNLPKI